MNSKDKNEGIFYKAFRVMGFGLLFVVAFWAAAVADLGQADGQTTRQPDWVPEYLDIGMSDLPSPPSLFTMPDGVAYRQQYLSGGAGTGWTNWNNNGDFVKFYIQDSINRDTTPIFTYYMLCHSGHGGPSNGNHPCYSQEQIAFRDNLADSSLMNSYWADLKIFFEKAALFPNETVILHVEPDMWGHIQQLTPGNDATQYGHPVRVGGSGFADLAGIPDTPQGFADGLYRLRDVTGAQNVLIGYHLSMWGTDVDFVLSDPSPAELQELAAESIQFYQTLGREFDLTFFEIRDRDAGFYQFQWGIPNAWWQQNDWDNHIAWITRYSNETEQSVMLWQLPYGNTQRSEMDNTWGHYQDNIVETLLGESDYSTLKRYADAGVVAIVFGQGASGTTCPCDSNGDGRIDDGGYFNEVATKYINESRIKLDGEPEVVTLSARLTRFATGVVISWNEIGADSYEIWWADNSNVSVGSDCAAADNCVLASGTAFRAQLPDGVDSRYLLLVARTNGAVVEVSDLFQVIRLTETIYLPIIAR